MYKKDLRRLLHLTRELSVELDFACIEIIRIEFGVLSGRPEIEVTNKAFQDVLDILDEDYEREPWGLNEMRYVDENGVRIYTMTERSE